MPRKSNKSNKIRAQKRDKTGLWCVSENNEEEFDVIHVDNDENEEDCQLVDFNLSHHLENIRTDILKWNEKSVAKNKIMNTMKKSNQKANQRR